LIWEGKNPPDGDQKNGLTLQGKKEKKWCGKWCPNPPNGRSVRKRLENRRPPRELKAGTVPPSNRGRGGSSNTAGKPPLKTGSTPWGTERDGYNC